MLPETLYRMYRNTISISGQLKSGGAGYAPSWICRADSILGILPLEPPKFSTFRYLLLITGIGRSSFKRSPMFLRTLLDNLRDFPVSSASWEWVKQPFTLHIIFVASSEFDFASAPSFSPFSREVTILDFDVELFSSIGKITRKFWIRYHLLWRYYFVISQLTR